ncbi:hypothetical protein [Paraburkholderia hospita]|uniref:hypothetical protein n=1 Tax=Paraburkholderia hospita TaxID=169430 RepID=UPI000271C715|nr:hypothetical protein [Paraburkholderia hospita]SKC93582.1 hypothetical protein SAMN06266956_5653 [Paraburkholderia hospita]
MGYLNARMTGMIDGLSNRSPVGERDPDSRFDGWIGGWLSRAGNGAQQTFAILRRVARIWRLQHREPRVGPPDGDLSCGLLRQAQGPIAQLQYNGNY